MSEWAHQNGWGKGKISSVGILSKAGERCTLMKGNAYLAFSHRSDKAHDHPGGGQARMMSESRLD